MDKRIMTTRMLATIAMCFVSGYGIGELFKWAACTKFGFLVSIPVTALTAYGLVWHFLELREDINENRHI